jgi:hypothetical protein
VGDAADVAVESEPGTKCSAVPSSMTLYQISYVNGKPSYSLVAIKPKAEQPAKDSGAKAPKSEGLSCEECGLKFATELRLNWHRSTHDPLKQRKAGRRQLKMARHRYEDAGIVVLGRSSPKPLAKSPYLDVEEAVAVVEEELAPDQQSPALDNRILTFICPSCEFSTSERGAMIDHFTATHCFKSSHLKIEVDERQLVEDTGDNADNTVLQQLESIELACSKCGFSSDNQDDLDFHTCLPSEEQMFSCHLCTYECLTRTGLQSHITRKHKPKPESEPRSYECDACDFKCANKNTLYSHKRKHRPGKAGVGAQDGTSYFCNECDFSAKRKGSLYLHIQRRHKSANDLKQSQARPNFYSCDQCDYTNKNKYEMKVHVIRKHTNEYNHECETCGKKYKIRGDLTNHIRFQHREQPIICDVCGKTCGNSNSLYVHLCHRRMVSQANLDDHILKQHEQREDAVCEECGKTFSRQSRLKIHMRIHSGVKPHSCKICAKAFSRKTALRQHLLIHTGQRPYVCDICGKAFTQKPGLISHRKSHPGLHPPLPRVTIDHVLSELLTDES